MTMTILISLGVIILLLVMLRAIISIRDRAQQGRISKGLSHIGVVSQTTGNQEFQADAAGIDESTAGILAVLSDGIGKANTGKICSQIATDTLLDSFQPYHVLHNPEYFFKTSFHEAHKRIQKIIEDRKGGACLAAAFVNGNTLHYGLAGDIRIAILRNEELIPISKGHTLDVLALNAYKNGALSRNQALWTMEEKRVWNFVGMDGFHEIEVADKPVTLKPGDNIILITKGVYEVLSWADIEDILLKDFTLTEKADNIIMEAERKSGEGKENGSVLLLMPEVRYEKN